jgi:hypothetical protein
MLNNQDDNEKDNRHNHKQAMDTDGKFVIYHLPFIIQSSNGAV